MRSLLSRQGKQRDFSYFLQTYPLYFAFGVIAVSLHKLGITLFIRYDARHQKLQNLILRRELGAEATIAMQPRPCLGARN